MAIYFISSLIRVTLKLRSLVFKICEELNVYDHGHMLEGMINCNNPMIILTWPIIWTDIRTIRFLIFESLSHKSHSWMYYVLLEKLLAQINCHPKWKKPKNERKPMIKKSNYSDILSALKIDAIGNAQYIFPHITLHFCLLNSKTFMTWINNLLKLNTLTSSRPE